MKYTETLTHGDEFCPVYNEPVLPNEQGRCSLCDSGFDETIDSVIRTRVENAFLNGSESAVHHIKLYGTGNVLTGPREDSPS